MRKLASVWWKLVFTVAIVTLSACKVDQVQDVLGPDGDDVVNVVTNINMLIGPSGTMSTCPAVVTITVTVQGQGEYDSVAAVTASGVTVTKTGPNTWTTTLTENGTYTFIATAGGKTAHGSVTVNCGTTAPVSVLTTINYTPPGGTFTIGWSQQAQVICYDQFGNVMACPSGLIWSSNAPAFVSVTSTGFITCIAAGSAVITVRTSNGGLERSYVFYCQGAASQTFSMNMPSLLLYPPACPASGSSMGQLTLLANGSAVTSGVTWNSSNSGVATVNSSGYVTAVSPGTVTITASTPQGSATSTVTVNACPQSTTLQLSHASLTLQAPGVTCTATSSHVTANMAVTWSSSNPGVASISTSSGSATTVTGVSAGTTIITATAPDGQTRQFTVTVNACQQAQQPTVTVVPKTQVCIAGSQATFSASVQNVTSGQPTNVIWTISSNQNVASIVNQGPNTVVINCGPSTGTVTVTARWAGNQSIQDTGQLTVNSSPAPVCPSTIDYTPGGTSVPVGQTRVLTSVRPSPWPSGCRIIWETDRPSIFHVKGDTEIQIDGTMFVTSGFSADLKAISQGSALVTAAIVQVRPDGTWHRTGVSRTYTHTATQ